MHNRVHRAWQVPFYRAAIDRGPPLFTLFAPLAANGPVTLLALTRRELRLPAALIRFYPSQWQALAGLGPMTPLVLLARPMLELQPMSLGRRVGAPRQQASYSTNSDMPLASPRIFRSAPPPSYVTGESPARNRYVKLAAVIPCFRVRRHIVAVVEGVLPHVDHVFVVDDCCPELTGDLVAATFPPDRVTVMRHPVNQGVGGATVTGYCAAFAAGHDIAIKIDGDGQMDAAHIQDLVHPIIAKEADYTKGNRFYQREHLARMPMVRLFGNSVLSLMTKISSGYWNIMDPTNGYTALHAIAAKRSTSPRSTADIFSNPTCFFASILREPS